MSTAFWLVYGDVREPRTSVWIEPHVSLPGLYTQFDRIRVSLHSTMLHFCEIR